MKVLILILSLSLAFAAIGQQSTGYDTNTVKPTKETRRKSRRIIDSLSKTMSTPETRAKKEKENAVKVHCISGNLEFDYDLGDGNAKVVLYDSDGKEIGEYDLVGNSHQIPVYNMEKLYFYDLYINGHFIKTDKVEYEQSGGESKGRKWALPKK